MSDHEYGPHSSGGALTTASSIRFTGSTGEPLVLIRADGTVQVDPSIAADEASRVFWEWVAKNSPGPTQTQIERERCAAVVREFDDWPIDRDQMERIALKIMEGT